MIGRVSKRLSLLQTLRGKGFPKDFTLAQIEIIDAVRPFTLTSAERIVGLLDAVEYIVRNNIPGPFVECGVWRGGSMMAVALLLKQIGHVDRDLYLFDTFTGMTLPTSRDVTMLGTAGMSEYRRFGENAAGSNWCYASLDDVKRTIYRTGYPREKIHFVQGMVEDTLPAQAPEDIALLRLDTDWYQSTYHELAHLFPRLARGGVLIIDDYGHWLGSQQATDDYLAQQGVKLLLQRMDYTGRIGVKL